MVHELWEQNSVLYSTFKSRPANCEQLSIYSPSWEKLNLVPEGDVILEPEEKGELTTVS